MENQNRIGQDFTTLSLLWFSLPAFLMNFFSQIFRSLDDGLFVSRYVGETALASLNILNPLSGVLLALTHLFSLGGANISARLMGQGKQLEAKEEFSRLAISGFGFSFVFALLVNIFSTPILHFLGASGAMQEYALTQIRIVYSIAPITVINTIFSCYYSTAGKPKMGMICSIVNGVTNISLDILLIVILKMGILGAAIATAMGDIVVFFIGLFFFFNKKHEIHFVKVSNGFLSASLDSARYALPQCINSLSFSLAALISNKIILSMIGSQGVAVNAIVSDIRKIITSGLVGFAACVGPIIAYNYGKKDVEKLRKILGQIVQIWFFGSIALTLLGFAFRKPLISIFLSDSSTDSFFDMANYALSIELLGSLPIAGCIIISRGFIALSNPKMATLNSIMRNLVIKIIVFIALPLLIGEKGIWISQALAETLSFLFGCFLVYKNADNYGYGKSHIAYAMMD